MLASDQGSAMNAGLGGNLRRGPQERVMHDNCCPNCGGSDVVTRRVNDRLRAVDPYGEIFELALQLPVWSCRTCKLCWQGEEAAIAREVAYQNALINRSPTRTSPKPGDACGDRLNVQ